MYLQDGKLEKARRLARRAINAEPTIDRGYRTLLDVALVQRDHLETARLLALLEESFGWTFDDLGSVDACADFVRSPDYQGWIETRRAAHSLLRASPRIRSDAPRWRASRGGVWYATRFGWLDGGRV